MNVLIALQTHSIGNSQDTYKPYEDFKFKRYGCDDKSEVTKRCVRSLIKSVNYAITKLPDWTFKLNVFDDHSDQQSIEHLKSNLNAANFPTTLTHLETRGLLPSLKACYDSMYDEGTDLVFQAQDDYLFDEVCFYEMIRQWIAFQPKFNKPLSLLPYNDPYRYWDHNIVPVRIVQGPDRHWRQTYQVPCTFLTHKDVLVDNWDLFEKICSDDPHNPKLEDESINRLWQERGYVVMSPLPSLALHFQTNNEKDPYIDWKKWWDSHADPIDKDRQSSRHLFETDQKVVLNIGCGKTKLNSQSAHFGDWKEVRVDAFENDTAHLVSSIVDLENIPNESVDAVWASHVVEHQYWHELPQTFRSMIRVLKEDGFAIVRVPDIASIVDNIKEDILKPIYESSAGPVAAIDMIYGHRGFVQSWGDGMCHKTGFTKNSMAQVLESLGIQAMVTEREGEVVAIIYKSGPPLEAMANEQLIIG